MKTSQISTQAITESTRLARTQLQIKLATGQKEATTGRLADVGLSIGYQTGRTVSLRQDMERLTTFMDTNTLAASRLEISQTTLGGVADAAQAFINTLVAARSSATGARVAVADATAKLASLIGAMNTSANGAHLFAGVNSDVKPLANYYDDPPPAGRTAVATEFMAAFGVAQSAPGVEAISAADMQTFLDGAFAGLFGETEWKTNWSAASDQNITTRISTNELIETATNANTAAVRMLASAYTMISDLGIEQLSEGAYQAVIDTALALVGQGLGELTKVRATLGTAEERIKSANEHMTLKIGIMSNHINLLEGVDPYEAASHVNALLTQIETAYALTVRIQKLSLINYL